MNSIKLSSEKVRPKLRVGAGGNWQVFNEVPDPRVVKQQSEFSCGPACGEMLLRERGVEITQDIIEQVTGAPVFVEHLARALNQLDPSNRRRWQGGYIEIRTANREQVIKVLNSTGTWAAMMRERGAPISHLVIITGLDRFGRLKVQDPYEGTSYTMDMKEFVDKWNGNAVYCSA